MAERRAASLLDFAIAASIAVVPVLLGVRAAGRRGPPGRRRRRRGAAPQRPLRQRAPGRGAQDLRARDRAPRSAIAARAARRRAACSPACPRAGANGAAPRPCARLAGRDRPGAHAAAAAGRADRRAAGRARRRAAALQQPQPTRASSTAVGFDAGALVRRRRATLAAPVETPDVPGPQLPAALRRPRRARSPRCARADARMLDDARLARHRGPRDAGALAPRPGDARSRRAR